MWDRVGVEETTNGVSTWKFRYYHSKNKKVPLFVSKFLAYVHLTGIYRSPIGYGYHSFNGVLCFITQFSVIGFGNEYYLAFKSIL